MVIDGCISRLVMDPPIKLFSSFNWSWAKMLTNRRCHVTC